MSETTLITKRYNDMASFASKVNKSVIVFKKKSLLEDDENKIKYPKLNVSVNELELAKKNLRESLQELDKVAATTERSNVFTGEPESSALQTLVLKNETDRNEIDSILHSLDEGQVLTRTNFVTLDKIISILDNERNLLFKKMKMMH
ncbi:MAG TPA: hypothetical protein VIN08_01970 [Ohtaekwangia sp.]|uniref:hypothetical protein n=1 Tax=Ohtaekwangia sp. TaxID=2066019 RepID=UPI002F95B5DF